MRVVPPLHLEDPDEPLLVAVWGLSGQGLRRRPPATHHLPTCFRTGPATPPPSTCTATPPRGGPRLKEADLPKDAARRWGFVRGRLVRWVDEHPEGRLLVVIDDLPEGVRGAHVIPPHERIAVIVTTRNALLRDQGFTQVGLDEFAPEESMLLLTNAKDPDRELRRRGDDPWAGRRTLAGRSRPQRRPPSDGCRLGGHPPPRRRAPRGGGR